VDRDSIDRIRSATFPVGRRGYDKREVDRFLAQLADWLETGGADQSRAELVRRDLERIGETTGKILTEAHAAAEQIRVEVETEVRRALEGAESRAEEMRQAAEQGAAEARAGAEEYAKATRADADDYAAEARAEIEAYSQAARDGADAYAAKVREEADAAASELRARADADAERTLSAARAEARRTVDEANRRREDIETVVADLEARRESIVGELERLASEVAGTATLHRPGEILEAQGQQRLDELTVRPDGSG
jgi:DivIVA domain-containing protein